jgi:outer membrane protein with beta-barrel domain
MRIRQDTYTLPAHQVLTGSLCTLFLLVTLLPRSCAQTAPYIGAMGGIAVLSADAGSQATSAGLNLSSYAPANGGALDLFAGVRAQKYFALQLDYIRNSNDLRLNSASSNSATFYEQDRKSSQQAVVFNAMIYFRRASSRIRPYLGTGVGVVHLSSPAGRLVASGGAPVLPPGQFSSTSPAFRAHVGIDLRLTRRLDFRYSFSDTIGSNAISKQLSPPGPRGLENFQNLFGFVVRFRR